MFDMLNEIVLWWHWVVFGLALLVVELITGTFFVLTFAVAAVLVGIVSFLMPISFNSELLLWIVLSIIGMIIWFKWLRDKKNPKSGQSNYRFDTNGVVVKEILPKRRGEVVFDIPVLGNTTWVATSDEELSEGSRVEIVEVNGQLIKVKGVENDR